MCAMKRSDGSVEMRTDRTVPDDIAKEAPMRSIMIDLPSSSAQNQVQNSSDIPSEQILFVFFFIN